MVQQTMRNNNSLKKTCRYMNYILIIKGNTIMKEFWSDTLKWENYQLSLTKSLKESIYSISILCICRLLVIAIQGRNKRLLRKKKNVRS